MLDHALLSDALGYLSILCWLGAQFPQVIVNIRTKSVEGLALPFLANWLFGDITNLVGCILTHQLPFQTYLASYFVFVDMSLVAQYIYYYKPPLPASPDFSPSSSRSPSLAMTLTPTGVIYSPRNLTRPSSRTRLLVGELEAGYRTYEARARSQTGGSRFSGVLSSYPPAGLLPSAEEVYGKGKERRQGSRASYGSLRRRVEKTTEERKDAEGKEEEEDEISAMTESFYSDVSASGGGNGAGLTRHVSWSRSLADSPADDTPGENTPRQGIVPPPAHPTTSRNQASIPSTSAASLTQQQEQLLASEDRKRSRSRGRASRRSRPSPLLVYELASSGPATSSGSAQGHSDEGGLSAQQMLHMNLDAHRAERERESKSGSRRRRSASIVFLSVGFGALLAFRGSGGAGEDSALGQNTVSHGRVLTQDISHPDPPWDPASISQPHDFSPLYSPPVPVSPNESPASSSSQPIDSSSSSSSRTLLHDPLLSIASFMTSRRRRRARRPHDPPPLTPEQKRRLIGRISAWACTTLYLTSRLPQIWKNYTRKSVQGLSLALFVFAFLGNTFYVASILSSPVLWEYSPDDQPISVTMFSTLAPSSNMSVSPEAPYNSPRARAFLRESLPYLLGSGGTLLFDVVIVSQGVIYGRRERRLVEDEEDESEEEDEGSDADGENSEGEVDKRTRAAPTSASVDVSAGAVGAGDDSLKSDTDART